jgi:hypothetical protein
MASEHVYSCGNKTYYVVERFGQLIVQRQDWLGRTFIGYASGLAQATALIRSDAGSSQLMVA